MWATVRPLLTYANPNPFGDQDLPFSRLINVAHPVRRWAGLPDRRDDRLYHGVFISGCGS